MTAAGKVMVTGATGFVGRAVVETLHAMGRPVVRALRHESGEASPGGEVMVVGDIGPNTDWSRALEGVDAVIHLAGRAHVMRETVDDPLPLYRSVNVEGTERLACAAAASGVRRLVYVSSVKVFGDRGGSRPYRGDDPVEPTDPYGSSKAEAEGLLRRIAGQGALEVCIVRPPLVYGPGVRGNFLTLMQWVDRGWPLPLARVRNRRSLVYVENLAHALIACVDHSAAAGRTFLVSDGSPWSTPDLVRAIASALSRPVRLLPIPVSLLRFAASVSRADGSAERLLGSLEVDDSELRAALDWRPTFTPQQGLAATASWFRKARDR
jgi:nucleoside-diphosphate-sugar epimerase